jgi:hydroxymethylglutaryl-CoA synthase
VRACRAAGFDNDQIAPGLAVTHIGNLYSGSCLAGLAAVLDIAEPRDKILVTSYGSGAGSDSYVFTVTDKIEEKRERIVPLKEQIESPHREYVDYNTYRKFKDLT